MGVGGGGGGDGGVVLPRPILLLDHMLEPNALINAEIFTYSLLVCPGLYSF